MRSQSYAIVDEGHEYLRTFILGTVTGVALVMLFQKITIEPVAGESVPSSIVLKASPMLSQTSVALLVPEASETSKSGISVGPPVSAQMLPVSNIIMLPTPLGNAKGMDFSKILNQVQQKNTSPDTDTKLDRREQDDGTGVHVVLRSANQDKPKAEATTPKSATEVEKKEAVATAQSIQEPVIRLMTPEVDRSYKIIQAGKDAVLVRYGNRVSNIPLGGKLPDGRKLESVDENTGELIAK